MKKNSQNKSGVELLVQRYKMRFRIPENLNHYTEKDYKHAERKFLKYAIERGMIINEEEV